MTAPTAPTEPPELPEPAAGALPAGPVMIDLDAKRAARREARGDALEVTNKGEVFRLPAELPTDALEPLARLAELEGEDESAADDPAALRTMREALEQGLAGLFCIGCEHGNVPLTEEGWPKHRAADHDEACQWPRFLRSRPSMDDELTLWEALFAAYSVTLGEAWASLASSPSDGAPSNETSGAGTGSTPATSGGASRKPARKTARKATAKGGRPSRR